MANDLDKYLEQLPAELEASIAEEWERAVEEELVGPISDAARKGRTGNLQASVRKERGRDDLEWIVKAGGPLTTKPIRDGATVEYDYAHGEEFGNSHYSGQPFFYGTARAHEEALRDRAEEIIGRVLDNE